MELYKKYFRIYGLIPKSTGKGGRIKESCYSVLRFLMRLIGSKLLLPWHYKHHKISTIVVDNLVVSLTSFPARLGSLWLTVESIKHQEILPSKIVLYLINEEITREQLPQSLLNEEDCLFEIRFRNGKLRAHGKYYFAMQDFPDSIITTVDDDMIYPPQMLKIMMECHKREPEAVVTNMTSKILFYEDGSVKSYNEWNNDFEESEYVKGYVKENNIIPMGVCGAMYPPHVLYKDVLNFSLAQELSYYADDLWLYAMTVLGNHPVIKTPMNEHEVIPIDIKNNSTLTTINCNENQNDIQFRQIRDYYLKKENRDIVICS
jgi:hypothetical protein